MFLSKREKIISEAGKKYYSGWVEDNLISRMEKEDKPVEKYPEALPEYRMNPEEIERAKDVIKLIISGSNLNEDYVIRFYLKNVPLNNRKLRQEILSTLKDISKTLIDSKKYTIEAKEDKAKKPIITPSGFKFNLTLDEGELILEKIYSPKEMLWKLNHIKLINTLYKRAEELDSQFELKLSRKDKKWTLFVKDKLNDSIVFSRAYESFGDAAEELKKITPYKHDLFEAIKNKDNRYIDYQEPLPETKIPEEYKHMISNRKDPKGDCPSCGVGFVRETDNSFECDFCGWSGRK